jgi:hypothetical protein
VIREKLALRLCTMKVRRSFFVWFRKEFQLTQASQSVVSVDISPSSQPDRALSALNYGLTSDCNLSQSHHEHTTIACAHTTGNSTTHLSQVSYRNLLRSQYTQGFNQCEHSYTKVYQHLNAHQLHLNAPYDNLSAIVSTSPVGSTTQLRHG